MNYIVLDLEWNQSPEGREQENPQIPFEILQIGAVKLDRDLNVTDQFCERIRPVVYPEIHYKIQEILRLNPEDYQSARTFPQVVRDFFSWCGPYSYFCTWGPSDLTELQRNLKYHGIESPFLFPLFFYDIQKIFSIVYEDRKTRRNLEFAVDYLGISKDDGFHDALSDARYASMVMKHISKRDIFKNYSIDCYRHPRQPGEEIYVIYETYSKYISAEFDSRLAAMKDRSLTQAPCYLCHRNTVAEIPWFVGSSKSYYCLCRCQEHGYFRGKIRFKKSEDGRIFCIRTVKSVGPEGACKIRDMQRAAREKKRFKRQEEIMVAHTFHSS